MSQDPYAGVAACLFPGAVLEAVVRLTTQLRDRQDEERRRFGRRFPEFDSRENNERARRLFGPLRKKRRT